MNEVSMSVAASRARRPISTARARPASEIGARGTRESSSGSSKM